LKSKLLAEADGRRTFVLVFDIGEEVTAELLGFASAQRLGGSQFTAIGALQDVVLGYWDWASKEYQRIRLREQVEVLSLLGNVARAPDDSPKLHAHIVVGKSDGTAWGGHLLEGHVRPTLEVLLTESPAHLRRMIDDETGLALLEL
jgi:predicted DNA-binding protein with PD1-like motif